MASINGRGLRLDRLASALFDAARLFLVIATNVFVLKYAVVIINRALNPAFFQRLDVCFAQE